MKKIQFLGLIILMLACSGEESDKKKSNAPDEVVKIERPIGPTLLLRYDFREGDKFSYKLHTNSNNTEEIVADTTIINEVIQNATYTFDFTVKKIDENRVTDMDVRISSILAETNFNGETIKYDSKFIYSTRERIQFVDYEAVKKEPFQISVNDIGQVVKVDKINKIMKNILEIQKVPDTLSAKTKEQMRINIANGTLMPLTQQIFKVLSDKTVGIDSVWKMEYATPLAVFNVQNTAVFRITDFDFSQDTLVTIKSNVLMNVMGNNVINENGMTYTFAQPVLDAEGIVKYNYSKGLVSEATSNTKLELNMFVEGKDAKNQIIKSTKKDISVNTNTVELL